MSASVVLPSLSRSGWLVDSGEILNGIIKNYLTSNPSQSLMYKGKIYSLQSDVIIGGNIMERVTSNIDTSLNALVSRYFPNSVIDIEVEYVDIPNTDNGDLTISIIITTEDGKTISAAEAINNIAHNFTNIYESISIYYGG